MKKSFLIVCISIFCAQQVQANSLVERLKALQDMVIAYPGTTAVISSVAMVGFINYGIVLPSKKAERADVLAQKAIDYTAKNKEYFRNKKENLKAACGIAAAGIAMGGVVYCLLKKSK